MRSAMVVAALALAGALAVTGCSGNGIKREQYDTSMGGRFISDSSLDSFTTVVDTRTGVTYLVWHYDHGSRGAEGGITVLVNSDGSPVISEEVAE